MNQHKVYRVIRKKNGPMKLAATAAGAWEAVLGIGGAIVTLAFISWLCS